MHARCVNLLCTRAAPCAPTIRLTLWLVRRDAFDPVGPLPSPRALLVAHAVTLPLRAFVSLVCTRAVPCAPTIRLTLWLGHCDAFVPAFIARSGFATTRDADSPLYSWAIRRLG